MRNARSFFMLSLLASCAGCTSQAPAPHDLSAEQRPGMLTRLGDDMRRNGDTSGAVNLYRAASQAEPPDGAPLGRMGDAFLDMNDPARAEQAFRGQLVIDPGNTAAERGLALALLAQGRAAEALPSLQKLADGSSDLRLLRAEGTALDMVGQAPQAQAVYRQALRLAPIDADLHGNLALSLALSGDRAEALNEMQAAVASPTPDPRQETNAVLVLALTGNASAAEARGDATIGAAATQILLARAQQALAGSDARQRAAAIGVLTSNTAQPPPVGSTLLPAAVIALPAVVQAAGSPPQPTSPSSSPTPIDRPTPGMHLASP
ncbi:tetratricopeptide repeat protein [Acidisphaera sp. S103]|uniref:tetratricopeptide repeat protein n=1 Tax=Acidisphaera sp. S103 TaxID=1747223 RepID=UPI00131CD3BA|nr:tetratricopeptide repeat protein [Acidisphaera sp. S103]